MNELLTENRFEILSPPDFDPARCAGPEDLDNNSDARASLTDPVFEILPFYLEREL